MNLTDPLEVAGKEPGELTVIAENLKHWQADMVRATCDRRFEITTSGYMLLGPRQVRPGDAVCVLQGGNAPLVLRPHGAGRCWLVGACYVHGSMNGEALQGDEPANQLFLLE